MIAEKVKAILTSQETKSRLPLRNNDALSNYLRYGIEEKKESQQGSDTGHLIG